MSKIWDSQNNPADLQRTIKSPVEFYNLYLRQEGEKVLSEEEYRQRVIKWREHDTRGMGIKKEAIMEVDGILNPETAAWEDMVNHLKAPIGETVPPPVIEGYNADNTKEAAPVKAFPSLAEETKDYTDIPALKSPVASILEPSEYNFPEFSTSKLQDAIFGDDDDFIEDFTETEAEDNLQYAELYTEDELDYPLSLKPDDAAFKQLYTREVFTKALELC